MTKLTILAIITAALASGQVEAFRFRFYAPSNCGHGNAPGSTFPRIDQDPLSGSAGNCYSAPTGVNWQRLEIDNPPNSVITFCNVNCQGSGSALQGNTHCFVPFSGCAIGSFKVV